MNNQAVTSRNHNHSIMLHLRRGQRVNRNEYLDGNVRSDLEHSLCDSERRQDGSVPSSKNHNAPILGGKRHIEPYAINEIQVHEDR